jgi:hypothetical protein
VQQFKGKHSLIKIENLQRIDRSKLITRFPQREDTGDLNYRISKLKVNLLKPILDEDAAWEQQANKSHNLLTKISSLNPDYKPKEKSEAKS